MHDAHHQRQVLIGTGLAVLATMIWSGNFIISRQVHATIPPITLNFYRWLTATIIMLPFAWKKFIDEFHIVKRRIGYFLLTSVMGISLFNTFVYIAGHHSTAINMALIGTTSSPIMSVILARIFLHEKITFLKVLGMLICIAGILLLLSRGSFETLLTFSFTKGDWWMLAAAFSFAVYNITAKKKPAQMSNVGFLFTVFLMGTIIVIPFYLYELKYEGGFEINKVSLFSIFYLGLGTSVICFLFWNIAIAKLGAGRTALFGNLIPVFSSIGAVFLLHEKITTIHLISFILVVAGLLIANYHKKRSMV
jgi:drug/metabolite transporter (DMT)-like permease